MGCSISLSYLNLIRKRIMSSWTFSEKKPLWDELQEVNWCHLYLYTWKLSFYKCCCHDKELSFRNTSVSVSVLALAEFSVFQQLWSFSVRAQFCSVFSQCLIRPGLSLVIWKACLKFQLKSRCFPDGVCIILGSVKIK